MLSKKDLIYGVVFGIIWGVTVYVSNMPIIPAIMGGMVFGAVCGTIRGFFFSDIKPDGKEM